MIQLYAKPKPLELTDDVVKQLTAEFKTTENAVWQKDFIKKPLLEMSFGKCCFCETKVNEESKYMEVEHFHPKKYYKDEVVLWENLLPICKRCNVSKSDHDSVKYPIIHPVTNNPKQHLRLRGYRFYGLTDLGKLTVKEVYLNDSNRIVKKRFEIAEAITDGLIELLEMTKNYCNKPSNYRKNIAIAKLENIMLEGTKEYEYSATAATIILNDVNYQEIKQLFETNNLWNDEFSKLERQVEFCALI